MDHKPAGRDEIDRMLSLGVRMEESQRDCSLLGWTCKAQLRRLMQVRVGKTDPRSSSGRLE